MSQFLRNLSLTFAAGCFGGLVHAYLVWYAGDMGIPKSFGVALAPAWSLFYLYSRIVWGGIWGLMFMAPMWKSGFWTGVFSRGIIFSFLPTAFQLFYVFPVLQDKGMMGLALGTLTPVFVCLFNAAWGICAGLWLHLNRA